MAQPQLAVAVAGSTLQQLPSESKGDHRRWIASARASVTFFR
jgi:hypothetical protein